MGCRISLDAFEFRETKMLGGNQADGVGIVEGHGDMRLKDMEYLFGHKGGRIVYAKQRQGEVGALSQLIIMLSLDVQKQRMKHLMVER